MHNSFLFEKLNTYCKW